MRVRLRGEKRLCVGSIVELQSTVQVKARKEAIKFSLRDSKSSTSVIALVV